MNKLSFLLPVLLLTISSAIAEPVLIRVGNLLNNPEPGEPGHHMAHTQRYFSDLVYEKSGGDVEIRFLEGKSLPSFQMPGMVEKS